MITVSLNLSEARYYALESAAKERGKSINKLIEESLEIAGIGLPERATPVESENVLIADGIPVLDKNSREILGYINNFSGEGLLLVTSKPLPVHYLRDVLIEIPDATGLTEEILQFQLEPRRVTQQTKNLYHIGCHLRRSETGKNNDLDRLKTYIRSVASDERPIRKALLFYLQVLDTNGNLLGHLGDISAQGMMIITEKELQIGQKLEVRIRLLETEELSDSEIPAEIEVRWARPDVNPELHCIGCLFTRLNESYLPVVKQVHDLLGLGT